MINTDKFQASIFERSDDNERLRSALNIRSDPGESFDREPLQSKPYKNNRARSPHFVQPAEPRRISASIESSTSGLIPAHRVLVGSKSFPLRGQKSKPTGHRSVHPKKMERSILVYQGLISLTALFLIASAEIASYDDNKVYKIKQKSGCPTVYCPWNCERYLDKNGCIYCGKCNRKSACPKVNCPDLPYFGCVPVIGTDGCTACKCREKTAIQCTHMPVCSKNCYLAENPYGCPRCQCDLPVQCPPGSRQWDQCRPECWRERNAEGCYDCRCPNDIDVCPEVPCPSPCKHKVDWTTGCAVACLCDENN